MLRRQARSTTVDLNLTTLVVNCLSKLIPVLLSWAPRAHARCPGAARAPLRARLGAPPAGRRAERMAVDLRRNGGSDGQRELIERRCAMGSESQKPWPGGGAPPRLQTWVGLALAASRRSACLVGPPGPQPRSTPTTSGSSCASSHILGGAHLAHSAQEVRKAAAAATRASGAVPEQPPCDSSLNSRTPASRASFWGQRSSGPAGPTAPHRGAGAHRITVAHCLSSPRAGPQLRMRREGATVFYRRSRRGLRRKGTDENRGRPSL